MAKEVAIGKRLKITKAQQNMLLAVGGASILLGAGIALTVRFVQQISLNTQVIMAEDEAIVAYSDVIKNIGICKAPAGAVYTDEELKNCNPYTIELEEIKGTLREKILRGVASNEGLNAVPKETNSGCINPANGKGYTYSDLDKIYKQTEENVRKGLTSDEDLEVASQLMQTCSALRIIPDALPAYKNEEALLASLNNLFIKSGWQPKSLSPSGKSDTPSAASNGLDAFAVNFEVEGVDTGFITRLLDNMERSIREFNVRTATIQWNDDNTLKFSAQASAFYMTPSELVDATETVKPDGTVVKAQNTDLEEED